MFALVRRSGRGLLALGAVAAVALAGCSGNTSTPTPATTPTAAVATPAPTTAPTEATTPQPATPAPAQGCDLAAAGSALAGLTSYQFKMVLGGSATDSPLQDLPLDIADSYSLKGTIVNEPAAASDITIDKFHVIEIGGYAYFDPDGNGTFTQVGPDQGSGDSSAPDASPTDTPPSETTTSITAQFSPQQIYASSLAAIGSNGYTVVGTETKDGVEAVHCTAGNLAQEAYGTTLGVADATWAADVWIATSGGYPVASSLVATGKDKKVAYKVQLDLSKVNDPANQVVAPTNIGGA